MLECRSYAVATRLRSSGLGYREQDANINETEILFIWEFVCKETVKDGNSYEKKAEKLPQR